MKRSVWVVRNAEMYPPSDQPIAPSTCRVRDALRDQIIHSAHHVPHVANAQIPHVQRAKCGAIAGAAAIVRLENEGTLGEKLLHGIGVPTGASVGSEVPVGPP